MYVHAYMDVSFISISRFISFYLEKEVIGQFLMHLCGQKEDEPKTDWIIKKKDVRKLFDNFLNLPGNVKIRERLGRNPVGMVCPY